MIGKQYIMSQGSEVIFTIEYPQEVANKYGAPHVTFRVEYVEGNDQYPEAYFVRMLNGPDNTSDYIYIGKLDTFLGQVVRTSKSSLPADSFRFRILNRVLCRLWGDDGAAIEAAGYKVLHNGKCGRCNRRLTVPSSIETGIGPECAKMMCTKAS